MAGSGRCGTLLRLSVLALATQAEAEALKPRFVTSDQCIACHSNMLDSGGHGSSIGHRWRGSIMALSAKDPYWQAAVRREFADRPDQQTAIEDICSVCHVPMLRTIAVAEDRPVELLRYLDGTLSAEDQALAEDGVSCTVCHQISADNFGEHGSFDGGYRIEPSLPEQGQVFGPYEIDPGRAHLMQSAAAKSPAEGQHVQQSELCATCHTLFTPAVDGNGAVIGEFPEQVPYLEWQHSEYAETDSCQSCHMPEIDGPAPIASVLGEPRENVSQHAFRGGNVFMLNLLNQYRDELGVTTPRLDLERSAQDSLEHLQTDTAEVAVAGLEIQGREALIEIEVRNLAGHKLPTAYPSRRVWLHVRAHDQAGGLLFESGALASNGSIVGNDNDANATRFEPHYREIDNPEQVQIYESIMHDYREEVTTSLLSGVTYAKDNRLLPRGFDKSSADAAIAVYGGAADDEDFATGGDRIRYRISLPAKIEILRIEASLRYQSIGYRWAHNLAPYEAHEAQRFVSYYSANAERSAVTLVGLHVELAVGSE